jgi:hypothetical protein
MLSLKKQCKGEMQVLSFEKKVVPIIESIYDTLTPIEKTIAQYFLEPIPEGVSLSAQEVSNRLFVSIPSLTRFAQKCGYNGYRQFIYDYEKRSKEESTLHNNSTKIVLEDYAELLSKSFSLVNEAQLIRVCELLSSAKRVYIYGQGSSGLAALEMKFRFMRLGMICEAITDLHTMLMNRVLVDEDCLVIGITVSANESVVNAVNIAKNQGAKTVLITSKKSEELSHECDELVLIAMKNALEQGTTISPQFPVLVVIDILYSYYKEIDKERKHSIFSNTLHAIQPD